MTRRCTIPTGSRKWSMEEMTAYLDWDKAEDKRVQVIVDDCGDGIRGHRGVDYIRKMVDREMGLDSVENRGVLKKQNEPLKYLLPVEFLDAVKEVRAIPVEQNPHAPRPLFRHPHWRLRISLISRDVRETASAVVMGSSAQYFMTEILPCRRLLIANLTVPYIQHVCMFRVPPL